MTTIKMRSAARTITLNRVGSWLLFLTGAGSIAVAVLAEFTPGASPGFDGTQQALSFAGAVALLGGILTLRAGYLEEWNALSRAARLEHALKFLAVSVQLGLLALVIRQFRIESPAFHEELTRIIFFGFLVHHLLPLAYRMSFFLCLSVLGIITVFGVIDAAWLLAIGMALIGICNLKARLIVRVALLLGAAVVLGLMRAGIMATPWSGAILPILASMFMFRIIIYLYDLKHGTAPVSVIRTLSYFFLLPNVTFPLFPVIDYSTFQKGHYADDSYRIYQRGIQFMLLGVAHLLLYRLVNQYLMIPAGDVASLNDLARHLPANFLLYLRVSGQFHLIVGVLHLFGFRLGESHNLFFLASSFTDVWRRINIYWKDFMLKIAYYPAFFRLRRRGETLALVLSTGLVFVLTWALHSFQWFWLLGSFLLSWTDVLFWALLAVLLTANSLYETRRGRKRALAPTGWSLRAALPHPLRTAAMFTIMCVLWSLWSSPSLAAWLALWSVTGVTAASVGRLVLAFLLGGVLIVLASAATTAALRASVATGAAFGRSAVVAAVAMSALCLVASPVVATYLPLTPQLVLRDLRLNELSRHDADALHRGYYESLVGMHLFNSQLWDMYAKRPSRWLPLDQTPIARETHDFVRSRLRPASGMLYLGASFRTNRWGMRDQEYEHVPDPNTTRIALLGASIAMGHGVGDGEAFESVVEDRLNRAVGPGGRAGRYEILNFAVQAYSPAIQHALLRETVFSFEPRVVILVAHESDIEFMTRHLARAVGRGVELPFAYLVETVEKAGLQRDPEEVAMRRLRPFRQELLSTVYREFVADCKARNVLPIWLYVPAPGDADTSAPDHEATLALARAAGFVTWDLADVFRGRDPAALSVAEWDKHPNTLGHRLIADRVYQLLSANLHRFSSSQ